MPAITNPEHQAFPKDDKLYRIVWAGEILPPQAGTSTLRTRFWLKGVDEQGLDVLGSPIVEVTESAGTIPKLAIGSYWRNGRRSRPKALMAPDEVELEIDAPHTWQVVRAGDIIPLPNDRTGGQPKRWVDPTDLDLSFTTSNGRRVDGHQAWVVPARTTSGQEVIFLSHEIFRTLLTDATSEFANELLSSRWDQAENKFVLSHNRYRGINGEVWYVNLTQSAPYGSTKHLAFLSNVSDARRAANFVYPKLVGQGPMSQPVWIAAFPPVAGRAFRIRAIAKPLPSRNALLVTQILDFDPNLNVVHIGFTIPEQKIPNGETTESQPEPRKLVKPDGSNLRVPKPGDRRPGLRLIKMASTSVMWKGLPAPKRSARRTMAAPIPNAAKVESEVPGADVSVGVPGDWGSPRPGTFTPQEEREIANRFESILELLEHLESEKLIEGATPYPLVRPTPADEPVYCEFPKRLGEKPWKWSVIRYPTPRARLAMVLEINVSQERTIYWIEMEAFKENDRHHSLAIETVNGGPLEEGMLAALLDLCAREKGVWPKEVGIGAGTIICVRARHIYHYYKDGEGELSPNTFFYPLARLAHKKNQPHDKSSATDVSTEAEAHPE